MSALHSREELFAMAAMLGLSAESAAEMVAEHIARRAGPPHYVRAALNAALAVNGGEYFRIANRKAQRFLERRFGASMGVEELAGFKLSRHRLSGEWIVV